MASDLSFSDVMFKKQVEWLTEDPQNRLGKELLPTV